MQNPALRTHLNAVLTIGIESGFDLSFWQDFGVTVIAGVGGHGNLRTAARRRQPEAASSAGAHLHGHHAAAERRHGTAFDVFSHTVDDRDPASAITCTDGLTRARSVAVMSDGLSANSGGHPSSSTTAPGRTMVKDSRARGCSRPICNRSF